eukprot:gnl/Chilomastix_cuspidata/4433.p1 GENE.gnl/Chilomastix_cuspidata/4433~~gnl/Chilomastix_cuspidata/4433.p1  ORF type:complete len:320 (+),score=20.16 gnl/Chilomastix_cuspidata/4433:45-1004(+)
MPSNSEPSGPPSPPDAAGKRPNRTLPSLIITDSDGSTGQEQAGGVDERSTNRDHIGSVSHEFPLSVSELDLNGITYVSESDGQSPPTDFGQSGFRAFHQIPPPEPPLTPTSIHQTSFPVSSITENDASSATLGSASGREGPRERPYTPGSSSQADPSFLSTPTEGAPYSPNQPATSDYQTSIPSPLHFGPTPRASSKPEAMQGPKEASAGRHRPVKRTVLPPAEPSQPRETSQKNLLDVFELFWPQPNGAFHQHVKPLRKSQSSLLVRTQQHSRVDRNGPKARPSSSNPRGRLHQLKQPARRVRSHMSGGRASPGGYQN